MSLSCDLSRAEWHCIWQLLLQQGFLWQLQPLRPPLKSPAQWGCIQDSGLNNYSPLRTVRSQSLLLQGKIAAVSWEFYWTASKPPNPGLVWVGPYSRRDRSAKPTFMGLSSIGRTSLEFQSSPGSRARSAMGWWLVLDKSHPEMREKEKDKENEKQDGDCCHVAWAAPSLGVITPTQHPI